MLQLLRKHSRSWLIAVIIGAIVVVFIFWGIGGFRSERYQEVARVNGEPIFFSTYVRQYNQLLREFQERTQGELTEEDFQAFNLKDRALNLVIDEMLLAQAANRLGIAVNTAELQEHIRNLPYFQEDGQFSLRRYQAILSRARVSPGDFEAGERQNLLNQKVIQTVTAFAKVSDGEFLELFRLAREEVQVNYLAVAPEAYVAGQQPSEDAMAAYYREHQREFRMPEQVRARYMLFRPPDYAGEVKPSAAEVEAYIREHEGEFTRPKVIRVREVFLATPPQATPAQKQAVKEKAGSLVEQARIGLDFARLAEIHSQDEAGRQQGGDLGDIKRGDKPAAWGKVAFSLAPGDVGLAQTAGGFHVIRLEEIKERERLAEAEARTRASQRLKEKRSRELAKEAAQRARGEATAGNFAQVADKFKASLQETPFFALGDQIPGLDLTPAFKKAALALKVNELSRVVDLPAGFAIIHCLEQQPAHVPPLEKIKEQVRLAVSRQQARVRAEQEAAALLKRLQQGEPLAKVAADAKVAVQSSDWFSRSQGFLKQPLAQTLTGAAFQLSPQKPYPPEPLFWKDQYYILAFKDRRSPSPEEFQKEADGLRQQVLEQKRRALFDAWLAQERQQANIRIFEIPV
jgi:peptidyl-prolyl cis-trans isomerase D